LVVRAVLRCERVAAAFLPAVLRLVAALRRWGDALRLDAALPRLWALRPWVLPLRWDAVLRRLWALPLERR